MSLDPVRFAVPSSYLAYMQMCDRNHVKPLTEPDFKTAISEFNEQVAQEPNENKLAQNLMLMAKLGLGPCAAPTELIASSPDGDGSSAKTPLEISGPPVSRSTGLACFDRREIFDSPIKLNLVAGKVEGLDPNWTLEAVGRMPGELTHGGNLFVVHRGSANQLDDFRVDIGEADDLVSYPGRPARTSSGELSVKVQGVGTLIFPLTVEPYMAAGTFIEAVTGHKSDMPKLIRPASISPENRWPHLVQMLRNIELD